MPSLSFLFRTDVHVADHSPSSWKGDYPAEIWSNLEQVGRIAKEHDVCAVLDGGDFFHVKTPTKNSHYLVGKTARIHKEYPCPVYSVEGNHDIVGNNLTTLEKQPLGVLFSAGVFKPLQEEVFQDGALQVRVVGVPYSPKRTLEDLIRFGEKKPGDTYLIMVVHALAGLNPPAQVEDFFNEPVFSYPSLVRRNGPDVVCFGHWHRDQGVEEIQGRYFVNQGALSRGALVRENLNRVPKVSVVRFDESGIRVRQVPLDVLPASEVFDLDRKAEQEREHDQIDQFVKQLVTDGAFDPSLSIEDNIDSLDFAQEVKAVALSFIEQAKTGEIK